MEPPRGVGSPALGQGSVRRSMTMRGRAPKSSKTRLVGLGRAGCSCMRSARRLQRSSRMLKQGDDLVAALDAVRADEGRLGASRITSCGYFLQSSVAKTPNPDDPIPNFVRGRESTWLTFVLENPPHWAPVIFAMEQSGSGFPPHHLCGGTASSSGARCV